MSFTPVLAQHEWYNNFMIGVAAVNAAGSYFQCYTLYSRKTSESVSFIYWYLSFVGNIFYIIYALQQGSFIYLLSSSMSCFGAGLVLVLSYMYRYQLSYKFSVLIE